MALRTSKITSEILQTCNKYFSSNTEASLKNNSFAALTAENDNSTPQKPFRYKIANTEKPKDLPELRFDEEEVPLFAKLQPCANSGFHFEQVPQKWAETQKDRSPFPQSLKSASQVSDVYSDKQKAEDKLIKYKMSFFMQPTKHFSTLSSPFIRRYSRGPAENSSKGSCKQGKIDKCVKQKVKNCKLGSQKLTCPRLTIKDCKQSKGSNCEMLYMETHCSKKFAPYPSYSEACAERLPDDPSECQQCPWRTCDDADSIVPGKPVRHKRHYSTYCTRHLEVTGGVVTGPQVPPLATIQEYICDRKCGKTKSPCKEPPGPCYVRKKKEEQEHDEKAKRHGEEKKKASDLEDHMVFNHFERTGQDIVVNPCTQGALSISLDGPNLQNTESWIDIYDGPEAFLEEKRKFPNCEQKKTPKRPKGNKTDNKEDKEIIEIGNIDWWSSRGKSTVVTEPMEVSKKTWRKKDKVRDRLNNRVANKFRE